MSASKLITSILIRLFGRLPYTSHLLIPRSFAQPYGFRLSDAEGFPRKSTRNMGPAGPRGVEKTVPCNNVELVWGFRVLG